MPKTCGTGNSRAPSTSTRPTAQLRPPRGPRELSAKPPSSWGKRTGKRSGTAVSAPAVIETPGAMLHASRRWRSERRSIGLVPTMGALHAGHLSLVELARRENDVVVVSVFVNPIQFGPGEDFARYPRDPDRDARLLGEGEVDAIYEPRTELMYPPGASTRVHVGGIAEPLEGKARPGHFEGVATVVTKLLAAVEPDRAYFGQKDAQQVAVVKRLVRDLDLGVEIRVGPIVREEDGLALSSRNVYLDPAERKAAASLSDALRDAARAYAAGERDPVRLRAVLVARLRAEPLADLEYAELVDAATFEKPGTLAVIAARIGKTRLIDNHDLSIPLPG
ncbi:MAG: pantoate--beta-alanine ligase [Chloroflexi bacterium]|nr:MAG: pantoate--beta-alanine ligase [Chloroflexota bacterium]TMG45517.1 MAG: pantoate--beta-alanine ligase [Chloroflexota bacterium]